ncbi:MAG TPA: lipid A deacylase LpxR family protein, partial [Prosthecobacter sp.]|nr:lipid A deacylase LpxR family protein [Prosthecobacter sp.]
MLITTSSIARRFVPLLLLTLLCHVPAPAADNDDSAGTLGLYHENDMFAGTDRYYTSGVKLSWSSPNLERYSDSPYASPFLPLFDLLPYINEASYQKNLVFAVGQNIYTPDDTESAGLVAGDRPYAGWLYVGLGVVWKNERVRNSLVLDIGVVGSWSYAQEAQRRVHDLRGFGNPSGWDNQLHNELGVMLAYERTWRFPHITRRSGFDWE